MSLYRVAAHSICNLQYGTSKEIFVAFHNRSKYDYKFTIKELVKEFEGEFRYLEKKWETYFKNFYLIFKSKSYPTNYNLFVV